MIDNTELKSLLENLQQIAEDILKRDAAFFEALHGLKWEIDKDPAVRVAMRSLQATGRTVCSSFVPRVNIRTRTEDGTVALPARPLEALETGQAELQKLAGNLRDAANAVILRSGYRRELDLIINEAFACSAVFEGFASEVERAGYELVICLDLSSYAQIRASGASTRRPRQKQQSSAVDRNLDRSLSTYDVKFLKGLKISTDS